MSTGWSTFLGVMCLGGWAQGVAESPPLCDAEVRLPLILEMSVIMRCWW